MKKQTNILQKFWEDKLGIDYDVEFEYYKKLCGMKYKHKKIPECDYRYIQTVMFSSNEWKDHILLLIKELNIKELNEYSRFLNLNYRNLDAQDIKNQTIAVPLIFCFITICLSPVVGGINIFGKDICNFILYLVAMISIIMLFKHLFLLLIKGKEHIYKYFYQDIKEIVDERIGQIKLKG